MLWPEAPLPDGDSPQYLEVARDLQDLSLDRLHDRSFGYPLLLVLTGSGDAPSRALFFVSLMLHGCSVWLLATILRRTGASWRWLGAFCLVACLPPYVEPAALVMTENLAQVTLAVGLASLVLWFDARRTWPLLVSGVAFGYSGLTKPVYQPLALAIVAAFIVVPVIRRHLSRDLVRASVILIAGSWLVLGSAAWFNGAKVGYWGISPLLGFHLSTKTMLFVERLPAEYGPVRDVLIRERDRQLTQAGGTPTGSQTIWHARPALAEITGLSTPELSRYLFWMNVKLIVRAPSEYVQQVAHAAANYWFPAAGPLATMRSRPLRWLWTGAHLAVLLALAAQFVMLTAAALWVSGARSVPGAREWFFPGWRASATETLAYTVAAVIVLYTMIACCTIDIGEPRQRRQTDVLVLFMCVLAAKVWLQTLRAPRQAHH